MTVAAVVRNAVAGRLRGARRRVGGGWTLDEVEVVSAALLNRRGPEEVFIDVGAHVGSTTVHFARSGWTVHAFEPDSKNRAVLASRFSDAHNVHVDPRALSDEAADEAAFFTSPTSTGISSLSPFNDDHEVTAHVGVTTLADYADEAGLSRVTVLKTDVEGYDLHVLRGTPWDRLKPEVVISEFDDAKTLRLGYDLHDVAEFVRQRGYRVLVSEWEPVVAYGQSHRHRRVVRYSASRARDGWGNLVAVRSDVLFVRIWLRFKLSVLAARVFAAVRPRRA